MNLEEAVKAAGERMRAEGIEGWGLLGPEGIEGVVIEVAGATGCTSEQCNHVSHDPAAPTYRWLPPAGSQLIRLGETDHYGEGKVVYHVLRLPDGQDVGLETIFPRHYHAGVEVIPVENLPAWALAGLAERGE